MDVLAIGAHPDDIELGAGALVHMLIDRGDRVRFLALTDDHESQRRRNEASAAARNMGLESGDLHFAGFADGYLRADRDTVGTLRRFLKTRGISPDLVIVHTEADSNPDHVEANRLAHATFRETAFLHYPTHISCETDRFAPRVFVSVEGTRLIRKEAAIGSHKSQGDRIAKVSLKTFEESMGERCGLGRAEAFEVAFPGSSGTLSSGVLAVSESPFHRFWLPILGSEKLTLLYEAYERPGSTIDWPSEHEGIGRDALREMFLRKWLPSTPLEEHPSNSPDALAALQEPRHLLLVGGSLSNRIVRDIYNRLAVTRWVVEYELPRREHAYLLDKTSGVRLSPTPAESHLVTRDVGLVARKVNPYSPDHWIMITAGATAQTTRVGLEALARPDRWPSLTGPLEQAGDVEVIFAVSADGGGEPEVLDVVA